MNNSPVNHVRYGTPKQHRSQHNRALDVVAVLLALIAIAAIGAIAYLLWPYASGYSSAHAAAEFRTEASDTRVANNVQTSETVWPQIDWASLQAANPDARAWIYVPNTKIDYPIVQARESDPDFYLDHDVNGKTSPYGCPYLDASNESTGGIDSPLVIVYGHNLITGDMFTDFEHYSDYAYAAGHRQILLCTPEDNRNLDVIAVDIVDADYETIETGFTDTTAMRAYVAERIRQSDVVLGDLNDAERVYCFITCSYQTSNARTIVYAVETS